MAIFNVSAVGGAGPTYNLTVDSSTGVVAGNHLSDTAGNIYRVSNVPDGTHIDVVDDVSPDSPEGTPVTGTAVAYSPTNEIGLTQLPTTAPGWGEAARRDNRLLDSKIQKPRAWRVNSTSAFSTSSLTDVLVTGMTITPGAGTYLAMFSGQVTGDGGAKQGIFNIYAAGAKVAHSEREANDIKDQIGHTQAVVTVADAEAIEVRGRGNDTLLMNERSLVLIEIDLKN